MELSNTTVSISSHEFPYYNTETDWMKLNDWITGHNDKFNLNNNLMKVKITGAPPPSPEGCLYSTGGAHFICRLYLVSWWTAAAGGLCPVCYKTFQWRIFRFPSHAESTRLHVREHVFHHFSKVCSTQRVIVQIVTEAPERQNTRN